MISFIFILILTLGQAFVEYLAIKSLNFYLLLIQATLILFNNMLFISTIINFTFCLSSLINSIYTRRKVGLFCFYFQDTFEVTKSSEITNLILVEIVIGYRRLEVCLLVSAFFINYFCYCIVSIEPIKFILIRDC